MSATYKGNKKTDNRRKDCKRRRIFLNKKNIVIIFYLNHACTIRFDRYKNLECLISSHYDRKIRKYRV